MKKYGERENKKDINTKSKLVARRDENQKLALWPFLYFPHLSQQLGNNWRELSRGGCFDNIQKNVRTIYPEEGYLQLHRLCSWFMVCFILKPLPLMTEILENKLLCWMILISGVLCIFLKSEYLILDWFRKEAQCAVINMGLFSRVINMGLGRMQSPLQDVVQSLFLENRINDFTKTWWPSTLFHFTLISINAPFSIKTRFDVPVLFCNFCNKLCNVSFIHL